MINGSHRKDTKEPWHETRYYSGGLGEISVHIKSLTSGLACLVERFVCCLTPQSALFQLYDGGL